MKTVLIAALMCAAPKARAEPSPAAHPQGITSLVLTTELESVPIYKNDGKETWGLLDLVGFTVQRDTWTLRMKNGRSMSVNTPRRLGGPSGSETDTHVRIALGSHPWASTPQIWLPKNHIAPEVLANFAAFEERRSQRPHVLGPEEWLLDTPFSVLSGPRGEEIGRIEKSARSIHYQRLLLSTQEGTFQVIEVQEKDSMEVDYEVSNLLYFDRRMEPDGQELVQVLTNSLEGGLWVPLSDNQVGADNWAAHLSELDGMWREFAPGVTLHRKPDAASKGRTLPLGHYDLEPLGEYEGDWFKVRFIQYDGEFHCGDNGRPTGKTWEGWVLAITEEGLPAFGTYSRGC